MGVIEDVQKMLDRIPIWKRLGEVPAEVDDLKRRVAALEEKLGNKWPGDLCKYCGARSLRLFRSYQPDSRGKIQQSWKCGECDKVETRVT